MIENLGIALFVALVSLIASILHGQALEVIRAKKYKHGLEDILKAIVHQHKIHLEKLVIEAENAHPKSVSQLSEVDPALIDSAVTELMGTRYRLSLDQLLFITNLKVTLKMISDESRDRYSNIELDQYEQFFLDEERYRQTISLIGSCSSLIYLTEDFIAKGDRYKRPSLSGENRSSGKSMDEMMASVCSKYKIHYGSSLQTRVRASSRIAD